MDFLNVARDLSTLSSEMGPWQLPPELPQLPFDAGTEAYQQHLPGKPVPWMEVSIGEGMGKGVDKKYGMVAQEPPYL